MRKFLILAAMLLASHPAFSAPHVYWRMLMFGAATPVCTCVGLGELQFYDATGTYLSTGGTPTASSTTGGSVSNLFDANFGNSWSTTAPTLSSPAWVKYQFATAVEVSTVRFTIQTFVAPPSPIQIQYSDDNTTWNSATGVITPLGYMQFDSMTTWSVSLGSVPGGYFSNWRVSTTLANGGTSFPNQIAEVYLKGTAGTRLTTATPTKYALSNDPADASLVYDSNGSTYIQTATNSSSWLGYAFSSPQSVTEVDITNINASSWSQYSPAAWHVDGSNDAGATWTVMFYCTATWTGQGQTKTCGAPAQRGWIAYDQIRPTDRANIISHIFAMFGGGVIAAGNPAVFDANGSLVPANAFGLLGSAVTVVAAPTSSTSIGTPGQIATDSTYFYWCDAINHWMRVAGSSF